MAYLVSNYLPEGEQGHYIRQQHVRQLVFSGPDLEQDDASLQVRAVRKSGSASIELVVARPRSGLAPEIGFPDLWAREEFLGRPL